MEKILKVGDVIEVEGKRYKMVPEVMEKPVKTVLFGVTHFVMPNRVIALLVGLFLRRSKNHRVTSNLAW